MEYEERRSLKTPATKMSKQAKGSVNKLKALISAKDDKASEFIWNIMKPVFIYSAELVGEIADDIVAIDEAMRWGFNWEMGPFELWDAIGLERSIERMQREGAEIPKWVIDHIEAGNTSFYKKEDEQLLFIEKGKFKPVVRNEKVIDLKQIKETRGVIKKNSGASLIDLDDGVL